jgi:hypothetical protein
MFSLSEVTTSLLLLDFHEAYYGCHATYNSLTSII